MKKYQIFGAPIGNEKTTTKMNLYPAAPMMKYHQKSYYVFFSSLASYFHSIGGNQPITYLVNSI